VLDGGRYPIKRVLNEPVRVEADVFTDGHDVIQCSLLYRHQHEAEFTRVTMQHLPNDVWVATFLPRELGTYQFTVEAWVSPFETWLTLLRKRVNAGQNLDVELRIGAALVRTTARTIADSQSAVVQAFAEQLERGASMSERLAAGLDERLALLMAHHDPRRFATRAAVTGRVMVERERARFSAWYEFFPRSTSATPGSHGTLRDATQFLDYVASMGFDVVYLPPVHPIGKQLRKGPNNQPNPQPNDPGSPWAIGGVEGGHKSIHPQLGTLEDFRALVGRARVLGMEVAMDLAFQCSPDHPYVKNHPEWFRKRPDGTIQYAENPPKKYQDIYPFDFECEDWRGLWAELRSVLVFWIDQGVKIFRVDNPHTKPFGFWEWLLDDVKKEHPDTIFLAEAFTRPKPLAELAKRGFSQSYNYFPWRNSKRELEKYLTELTQTQLQEFLRPNLWPNTPDILPEFLQLGGRGAFPLRAVLAATLGASYGVYGPVFELCVGQAVKPGSEEYLDSEKYQLGSWKLDAAGTLRPLMALLNRVRKDNPALHGNASLRFHPVDNDHLLAFTKHSPDLDNIILVVANLDPWRTQSGWLELPVEALGLEREEKYQVHDLLGEARYFWSGKRNFVELNPQQSPAHIFRLRRKIRTEHDFEYFV